ncbi:MULTISPECIES: Hsp20/alpha crystallin family protein [unclassified Rhodococcus (in: high G+C Gram-positive bacteria)]|uniref:Hsp20/alpha crystallin family protein n=1 Tax=unclassified Rhodococcus (in: high G+C Gram-positive bacteria) TaxID=192944 RepID=UPI00163A8571|nr:MULTISPECIES: Hsp20/alpha crystallin family protein [unclassified Rhodococcus (in: high G+C Gram-positive bacteria)]MBC2640760.1 Hsp20/alpha crystallin family protein [Rhodococcus sp. 3A]MBC2894495.1 Hsp20/alpha crystallin family protein [Rhodococcus sp. 4CII]
MLRLDPVTDIDSMTKTLLGTPIRSTRRPRFMPMDLYKVDDHYVLHADLPGIDPGSIDIGVDAGILTLTAHRSRTDDGVQWLSAERFSGHYRRQVSVGENIDVDGISASYDNGVLTVILPVTERAKRRRIEITRTAAPAQFDRTPVEA